ncbi:MAG: SDR family oxidoreductase [Chloroflexi bacterium]|nr:SDR family oxidoreductase [Chloroflexota bacterium]
MKLAGRVAIVTGAGRGIGKAIAAALAQEGASVVAIARSPEQIEATARDLNAGGGRAIAIRTDVSDEASVQQMVDATVRQFGGIDILVNNAAVNLPHIDVVDMDPAEWRKVVDVNLTGPFLCARAVIPHMIKRRGGRIINISSIGGRHGAKGRGPYRAAKAGLINLTETLAAECWPHGINVNCICPGGVDTDMLREISGEPPRGLLMKPEQIASVVLFLASDESSAITGTAIDAFGPTNPLFR